MQHNMSAVTRKTSSTGVIATNKVIKNTYLLLSMTLIFSAITAGISTVYQIYLGPGVTIIGYLGLLFLTHALANSTAGIFAVFALTGFMGLTLGPILTYTLNFSNGPQIVAAALGSTGAIFFGLSGYAMTTKKDFSYLSGFLVVSVLVLMLASIGSIFFNMPGLHLAISAGFVLISSGFILFQTSQLINGGERNYILATIGLYVQIYNLFISLLHLFSALSGRND